MVLLPAPLGPAMPRISPGKASRSSPSRATGVAVSLVEAPDPDARRWQPRAARSIMHRAAPALRELVQHHGADGHRAQQNLLSEGARREQRQAVGQDSQE